MNNLLDRKVSYHQLHHFFSCSLLAVCFPMRNKCFVSLTSFHIQAPLPGFSFVFPVSSRSRVNAESKMRKKPRRHVRTSICFRFRFVFACAQHPTNSACCGWPPLQFTTVNHHLTHSSSFCKYLQSKNSEDERANRFPFHWHFLHDLINLFSFQVHTHTWVYSHVVSTSDCTTEISEKTH